MRDRDNFSWTTMISGYVRYEKPLEALELYRSKQISEKPISNKFTVSSALAALSAIQCLRLGKEIHGCITRTVLDSDEAAMQIYMLLLRLKVQTLYQIYTQSSQHLMG
ncbi:hypothetical protein QYF36_022387 [Acer negundo]|nr:hypothetical protein QYF36_022387 [Acer negundo]